KALRYNTKTKRILDITSGNRTNLTDPRDPGGRLGPYTTKYGPDTRNLDLYCCLCAPGDIIVLCSDGVHDNFDPQTLGRRRVDSLTSAGKKPSEVGLKGDSWDDVDVAEGSVVKTVRRPRVRARALSLRAAQRFMENLMTSTIVSDGESVTPST